MSAKHYHPSFLHAMEELAYQRSAQAIIDLRADKLVRAEADRYLGHTPQCALSRCASNCPSLRGGKTLKNQKEGEL